MRKVVTGKGEGCKIKPIAASNNEIRNKTIFNLII
jgi:hypothetical protein